MKLILEDLLVETNTTATSDPQIPNYEYLKNSPQAVGYPDAEMQKSIYYWVSEKLKQLHGRNESLVSLKDFGAGRGDIANYISHVLSYYIGYEQESDLVKIGKELYGNLDYFRLECSNFITYPLKVTDYTIVVGTLNSMKVPSITNDPIELFKIVLNRAIETTYGTTIFVLSSKNYGNTEYNEFPIDLVIKELPTNTPFEIAMTKFEDIYMLTVHHGGFNI